LPSLSGEAGDLAADLEGVPERRRSRTADVLGPALLVSLGRVSLGFLLAALSAVPLGVVLGRSKRLWLIFEPLVESFRFIIPFAWIPLAILWFGTHESARSSSSGTPDSS